MKCQICGVEAGSPPDEANPCGLYVSTSPAYSGGFIIGNEPAQLQPPQPPFIAVFGFWDHQKQVVFQICGSCLVGRLVNPIPDFPTGQQLDYDKMASNCAKKVAEIGRSDTYTIVEANRSE